MKRKYILKIHTISIKEALKSKSWVKSTQRKIDKIKVNGVLNATLTFFIYNLKG